MKVFTVAAAAVLFVGTAASVQPPSPLVISGFRDEDLANLHFAKASETTAVHASVQPPEPGPQPTISVASETPVYIPVRITVVNPSKKSTTIIRVPGAAWTSKVNKHTQEFTGPPGTYSVTALYIEVDKDGVPDAIELTATTKIVGTAPPGPGPGPGPTPPGPGPGPGPIPPVPDEVKLPFPAAGFYAVMVSQDTAMNKYTAVQRAVLGGQQVADYLNNKTTRDAQNQPAWRVFDADQQFTGEGIWKEAWKRAVADHAAWVEKTRTEAQKETDPAKRAKLLAATTTPWLICGNGTKGYSGPVDPESLDKTLEVLKTYGGP
jgi:hypothetical protein